MAFFNFHLISNVKVRVFEYIAKRITAGYIHEDYPINNNLDVNFNDGNLQINLKNIVLDKNLLNRKMSNVYYLNGEYLEDLNDDIHENNNPNLPIVLTQHPTIELVKVNSPFYKILEENTSIEIFQTRIHFKLSLLSDILSKQLKTNLQQYFRESLMCSSIQLAEKYFESTVNLNNESSTADDSLNQYEGYKALEDIIKNTIFRTEITFNDLVLILEDDNLSTIEIRIKRIEIKNKKKEDNIENNEEIEKNEKKDETFSNIKKEQNENLKEEEKNNKKLVKLIEFEHIELFVNSVLVCKNKFKHTIKYDYDNNNVEISISSILNLVLTPSQLDSIISIFTNKADESKIENLNLKNDTNSFDKKITKEEFKKVEEFLLREKENKDKILFSNKLNDSDNQTWSLGFGLKNNLNDLKFYELKNYKNNSDNENLLKQNTHVQPLTLLFKIPAITCSLLRYEKYNDYDIFNEIDIDLNKINTFLDSKPYVNEDHLEMILYNFELEYKSTYKIKFSSFSFLEIYNKIREKIIYCNDLQCLENIYIDFDLNKNQFNISTKIETLINIDLTLIERLHSYLSFYFCDENQPKLNKSSIIKSKKNKFKITFDFYKLNGRMFFPTPNLSEDLTYKFSELRNETLEFNSTNFVLVCVPEDLKLYCGYIELFLNENYISYRTALQLNKESKVELKSIKIAELRSLLNNLIELNVIFKPDVNSSILIKETSQDAKDKKNINLTSLNEDSVYMNNVYNLNSTYLPFRIRKKKIVREDNDNSKETEMILPNDKLQTTKYLNSAAKVSKMNVILNVPQFLISFSNPEELNIIYNKLVNDLILWSPFNGVDKKGNRLNNKKNNSNNLVIVDQKNENSTQNYHLFNSDGTSSKMNNDLVHFDENVFNYSQHTKLRQDLINDCLESLNENQFSNSNNKSFSVTNEDSIIKENQQSTIDLMSNSLYLCKSGLEESNESENLYHSLTYSTINPIFSLANEITFVLIVSETTLHFEHPINLDDVKNVFKSQKFKTKTKFNKNVNEFFNHYELLENQTIVGKKVLVGCVINIEKDDTTRIFVHGENLLFKMNNLGPVNKLQAASVQNNQFLMICGNKLVNNSNNCKLNFGIEIKRESPVLKKIKMAIQLVDSIIFQISCEEIFKFWSYLKVVDDKIDGYTPPKVLIELHVNLLNTAIFFESECFCNNFNNPFYLGESKNKLNSVLKNSQKSKNFDLQNDCMNCSNLTSLENRPALLLCDDTSIICLIMENTKDIMLKFTFDEIALFFAKKLLNYELKSIYDLSKNSNEILNSISLSNYVCNVSCGLLELNFILNNGELREVKLNNDLINVTCCYDSLAALICFLQKYGQTNKENNNENIDQDKKYDNQASQYLHCDSSIKHSNKYYNNLQNAAYNQKSKKNNQYSPLYDPSFLEDDEEDARINLMNQIKQSKPNEKLNLETSFYIFGVDDFGNGIKDFENVEPEYTNLSWGIESSLECYFDVPQMVNVPIFTPQNTLFRFFLQEMSINFHIYGGTDFFETFAQANDQCHQNSEIQDDAVAIIGERSRRSSTSSLNSCITMHTANSNVKLSTVRFVDNQQRRDSLFSNEKTYEKSVSSLSKFDYLATNFVHQSYSIHRNTSDMIDLIKSNLNENINIKANNCDALWEDLDLFSTNINTNYENSNNTIFRSNMNLAILKKSGGTKRINHLHVKLQFKKMKCLFEKYVHTYPIAWNISYACSEIELLDFVEESCINKMLYEYVTDTLPKRSQPMLSIKMVNNRNVLCDQKIHADGTVNSDLTQNFSKKLLLKKQQRKDEKSNEKNNFSLPTSKSIPMKNKSDNLSKNTQYDDYIYDPSSHDCDLIISMNPLRVNLDQDTILFLMNYFNDLSIILEQTVLAETKNINFSNSLLDQKINYYSDTMSTQSNSSNLFTSNRDLNKQPIFIKHFEFSQDVPIKLDYYGKRVDMKGGAIKGLLMGLAQLNGSELTLKSFIYRHGILGFEKLVLFVIDFWGMDIKKHQLPSILGGVGPVNSFIQLFRGIRDLFLMPIDQYRKDKRLVRGLQKGLFSFSTSSTIALLELTNKSLGLIEFASQLIYDLMLGTNTLKKEHALALTYENSIRWKQPRDAREGALNAYNVLTEGFQQASRNLTMVHSDSNTALSLMRKIPANAFILPILTTKATSNMLIGVRNQMTPQARKEEEDKWKKKKN